MNAAERIRGLIDWELAKKPLLLLSVVSLIMIPADGLYIYWQRSAPLYADSVPQGPNPIKFEPEASYLAAFDRSTLFGNASSNPSAPMILASVAELTKDYRLKGVMIAHESEAIVEDARTQKTTFIKVGGRLGDLTVKEIREGVIVLAYLGQDITLEIQ